MWINQVLQKIDNNQMPFFATVTRIREATIDVVSPIGEIIGVFIIKPTSENNNVSLVIGQQVFICSCLGNKYCCLGTTAKNIDPSCDYGGDI